MPNGSGGSWPSCCHLKGANIIITAFTLHDSTQGGLYSETLLEMLLKAISILQFKAAIKWQRLGLSRCAKFIEMWEAWIKHHSGWSRVHSSLSPHNPHSQAHCSYHFCRWHLICTIMLLANPTWNISIIINISAYGCFYSYFLRRLRCLHVETSRFSITDRA